MNYFPGLALNCDPPDLCLQSGWDYRWEPLHLAVAFVLSKFVAVTVTFWVMWDPLPY
jgi:hypothetical protein